MIRRMLICAGNSHASYHVFAHWGGTVVKPSQRATARRGVRQKVRATVAQAVATYCVFMTVLGCAAVPVRAQAPAAPGSSLGGSQTNAGVGQQPSQAENQPLVPVPAPAPETHLFDNWGGLRTRLHDRGVDLSIDYTTESAWNISGGIRRGADYAHQIGIQADLDWEKLAGIAGLTTHTVIINRAGRNASTEYVGDTVIQAQEIFGAGFDQAVNLVWFYAEEKMMQTASISPPGASRRALTSRHRRSTATS